MEKGKVMAKETKAKETSAEGKGNIENLASLAKEFETNRMEPRKVVALRSKLIELFKSEKITEQEQKLMETILKRERLKGVISDANLEVINRIEMDRCTDKCRVKSDDVPRVHYLVKDMICKYFKDNENDRFVVFVERVIPPEWQMTRDLVLKEQRGHFADESAYPKEKTLVRRLYLKEAEFKAWFDFEEDLLSEKPAIEEEYTF